MGGLEENQELAASTVFLFCSQAQPHTGSPNHAEDNTDGNRLGTDSRHRPMEFPLMGNISSHGCWVQGCSQ